MKNAIITGSSRGIGFACAEKFASEGYNVILNCVRSVDVAEKRAKELSEKYGVKAFAVMADVSNEDGAHRLFTIAESLIGAPSVLVNNAGVSKIGLFQDMTSEEWDEVFAINVKSVFLCSREAMKYMLSDQCGAIVNISSMWGQVGASCEAAYSASKAAVIGYTKALAKELAPSGIRVNCISPGVIDTEMNGFLSAEERSCLEDEIPLGRFGLPEEVAKAVYFAASAESSYMTGQIIGINGGMVI